MRNPKIGDARLSELVGFIIITMAGVLFVVVGAFSAADALQEQRTYEAVEGTATATIEVVSGTEVGNIGFFDENDYRIVIEYEYTVDGQTYQQSKVFADDKRPNIVDNRGTAESIIDTHGENPTVHYNPDDPSQSYLSANPFGLLTLLFFAFGGLTIIQGIYQMYDAITG